MNIQNLRYIVAIAHAGSINKAAQDLYISQSSLSRAVKEMEAQAGMIIFHRTNKGVQLTYDGQKFVERLQELLHEIEQIELQYFADTVPAQNTLLVATQRCTPIVNAFTSYYQQYCLNQEFLNLALQDDTTDNIICLVNNKIYGIGILHYTSDQEYEFLENCDSMDLECHLIDKSTVCAQVASDHPLACYDSITVDMLAPYPHITFSDEDITSINYCSDIVQYNSKTLKKRIVVQDRATLRQIIQFSDAYYIGCDFRSFDFVEDANRCYIPLSDVDFTLNTIWIKRASHSLTTHEKNFIEILNESYRRAYNH